MIPVSKAIKIVTKETRPLGVEKIALEESVGRVLAEDIVSDTDLPPFDRSQMDGYAVKAADTKNSPVTLKLVGESAAGRGWHKELKKGEAVRIMTGAPVPKGADAVQKIELTGEKDNLVTIKEPTEKGRYIIYKGKEIKKGKTILRRGDLINEISISIPAAFGYAKVRVAERPRVAILSTGSEIVEIDKKPKTDQIRNSNSVMLKALCERAGAIVEIFPIIGDSISDLKSQISNAVKKSDILITTGGVSVGKYDLTKPALKELGAEIFFERVRLKPGKPTVFARLKNTPVFALPGNPVSAAVTFYLFVRTQLMLMQGSTCPTLKTGDAVALGQFSARGERDAYLPGKLGTDDEGRLTVRPLNYHGSSDFVGFAAVDALVAVPRGKRLDTGDKASILFLF